MSDREYTLDDLVRMTGFSKRQIRFYITKKLVPGAGENRGPYAAYPEETLQRLLLVRDLKDRPVGPTGRTMSLDEIGYALDALEDERPDSGSQSDPGSRGGSPDIVLKGAFRPIPATPASAHDYLQSLHHAQWAPIRESEEGAPDRSEGVRAEIIGDLQEDDPSPLLAQYSLSLSRSVDDSLDSGDDLRDLLGRLQALLAELGSDTRYTKPQGEAGQWLRITTPDVEFHVRKPDDHVARARLGRLARELARLLEREE